MSESMRAEAGPLTWATFARAVIERAVRGSDPAGVPAPDLPQEHHGGVFVTLRDRQGRLRGCMGTLDPSQPLAEAVRTAAVNAALSDPRFPPVAPQELDALRVQVSILTDPVPMRSLDELQIGRHGVIVRRGRNRGLFLPQVATQFRLTPEQFLSLCCSEKAGLPPDAWRDPQTEVLLFETRCVSDPPEDDDTPCT